MEPDRQAKIASSLPVVGILAVIGLAFYLSQRPLETSRPEAPAGLRHLIEEEGKIDSRLWQDPLKVAIEHEEALHGEGKAEDGVSASRCLSAHCVNEVSGRIREIIGDHRDDTKDPERSVHILLVMVRSGLYAEDYERRVRNRYAVLTSLHTSGFAPEDAEHIQYFRLQWAERGQLAADVGQVRVPAIGEVCDSSSRVLLVPFEWFEKEELYPAVCGDTLVDDPSESILVVWLAEDDFSSFPLTRLAQVIDAIGYANCHNVKIDMIGPSYSGTLRSMIRQISLIERDQDEPVDSDCVDVDSMLADLTICSPWSTTSPAMLIGDWPDDTLKDDSVSTLYEAIPGEFEKIRINFVRMIGSDDLLVVELIEELKRRGVDVIGGDDRVALISEWDRFYGKAFPRIFATMMKNYDSEDKRPHSWKKYAADLNGQMESSDSYFPKNLLSCSYIRGIDGKLPEGGPHDDGQPGGQTESESMPAYAGSPELPTGRSQLDYIRRLAQEMDDEHDVKAFGVVGTDVYDKLLLFQALREQLGDVTLFTIDLDARMMHQEQFRWTHNVIVASNYGLELNDCYQRAVYQRERGTLPAFRDNYQTALFLGCRTALGLRARGEDLSFREMRSEQLTEVLRHPRLFEIGRGRAVDLSVRNADIHPGRDRHPPLRPFLLCVVAVVAVVLLFCQISQSVQKGAGALVPTRDVLKARTLKKLFKLKKWNWPDVGIRWAVFGVILFVALTIIDHYRPEGEPFSLVAGVSIWPGEALRLIAAILSVWFIAKSLRDLRANEDKLCRWFNPKNPERLRQPKVRYKQWFDGKKSCGRSKHLLNLRGRWRYYKERISIHRWSTEKVKEGVEAERLWRDYLIRGDLGKRVFRTLRFSATYVLLAGALIFLLGGPPHTPYRGRLSLAVDIALLLLSVGSMIFLIFFVVDATKLSLRFIRNIKVPRTRWPEGAVSDFKQNQRKVPDGLEEWLDIRFIARLTEAVGKLIYYPFIVLLIMFVSRNPYFDNWGYPLSLIIIFLLNSTWALCCARMLRVDAEKARRVALDRLGKELVEAAGADDKCRTKQLEAMIEQVRSVRRGAYSPFTDNPVLHAILIPSGGLSVITLLRFFLPS